METLRDDQASVPRYSGSGAQRNALPLIRFGDWIVNPAMIVKISIRRDENRVVDTVDIDLMGTSEHFAGEDAQMVADYFRVNIPNAIMNT